MNYSLCWVQYSLDLPAACHRWGKAHRASAIPTELLTARGFQGRGFFPDESTRFCCLVSCTVNHTALVKLSGSESKMKRQKHGKWNCRGRQRWERVKRCWRERISNIHLYTYHITGQISFIKIDEYKIQVRFGLLVEREQEIIFEVGGDRNVMSKLSKSYISSLLVFFCINYFSTRLTFSFTY